MEAKKKTKKSVPRPPDELDGEAILEWGRICDELAAHDRLNSADRAIMSLHCQWWSIHQSVAKAVAKFGPVVKWPNGVPGPGPFFKVMKEAAGILDGTLSALGLTPKSRGLKETKDTDDDDELEL